MADAEGSGIRHPQPERGFWRSLGGKIGGAFNWADKELSYVKGLTLFGVVSTLLVAYFQNLSAYESKVATQAKDDMAAATQTFAEASTNLSTAVTLQRRLIADFYSAVSDDAYKSDAAYPTKDARAIFNDYASAYSNLHQSYNLLARKAEIYLDWPSDPTHDAASNPKAIVDPINMSLLGAANYDCEKSMPNLEKGKERIPITDPASSITYTLDWWSALHHVLTIEYCFDVTHAGIAGILQWASQSTIDPKQWAYVTNPNHQQLFNDIRGTNQALRLNAFVSLAMHEIEQIRVKYRPNGFICSFPGVSQVFSMFDRCTALRTKSPLI